MIKFKSVLTEPFRDPWQGEPDPFHYRRDGPPTFRPAITALLVKELAPDMRAAIDVGCSEGLFC